MSQHKKNISVKCKILLKNILSFLDKIFKIYVETTHCKCGVFLPKWDNKIFTSQSFNLCKFIFYFPINHI
ncbi:hypothetical protein [Candidatus Tisiphia endosymbiont of Parasteatoda lunata]|uniref:hypothetical protein n=1 Tax=Candidatus Tisiphia endosymbiont of Parasteatoda lunata TaxID=3066275 RepID=UPI00313BB877